MDSKQYVNTVNNDKISYSVLLSCLMIGIGDQMTDLLADEAQRRRGSVSQSASGQSESVGSSRHRSKSARREKSASSSGSQVGRSTSVNSLSELEMSSLNEALQLVHHARTRSERCDALLPACANTHLVFTIKLVQTKSRHKVLTQVIDHHLTEKF